MNSLILEAYPYQNTDLSSFRKKFVLDEKEVDRALLRLVNKHIKWTEGKPVSVGDVVQCNLLSRLPKFNRDRLQLTVGAGLFDKELEVSMIGKAAGDVVSYEKDGEAIKIELVSVRNKQTPALADEFVKELAISDVNTIEEYKNYLKKQQFEAAFSEDSYEPLIHIRQTVLAKSKILLSKEDWKHCVDLRMEYLRGLAEFEGLKLETMTAEEFEGRIPVKSCDELLLLLQDEAWEVCRLSLLGRQLAKTDHCAATQTGYDEELTQMSVHWNKSMEQCRKVYAYDLYEMNYYVDYFGKKALTYIKEHLYEEK